MTESSFTLPARFHDRLREGLDALDVSYGEEAVEKLIAYMELLIEWNQTHNLTSIDDPEQMLGVHVFDCASIKPYVKGASILDVGSGAGLPGLVLAILSPALGVTSIEARNKKAQFQTFAANKLKLQNFTVVNDRVEEWESKEEFPMIVCRAFSGLEDFVEDTRHLITGNGRWLAMKGAVPMDEIKALKKLGLKSDTFALSVPELDAQRNLVVISKAK